MAIDIDFDHLEYLARRTDHKTHTTQEIVTLRPIGDNLWVFRTSEGGEGVGSLKTLKTSESITIMLRATDSIRFPLSNKVRNKLFEGQVTIL